MKVLKNTSTQGLSISFTTPEGSKNVFLRPNESLEVPTHWSSKILNNLVSRRKIKIALVEDEAPQEPVKVEEPVVVELPSKGDVYVSPKRNNKHR